MGRVANIKEKQKQIEEALRIARLVEKSDNPLSFFREEPKQPFFNAENFNAEKSDTIAERFSICTMGNKEIAKSSAMSMAQYKDEQFRNEKDKIFEAFTDFLAQCDITDANGYPMEASEIVQIVRKKIENKL